MTGSVWEQEHTLQCGLDAVQSFLEDVGMTASPEKTEYVVVLSGPQHLAEEMRTLYNLTLNNTTIRQDELCAFSDYIDLDGRVGTWLSRVEKESAQMIHWIHESPSASGSQAKKRPDISSSPSALLLLKAHLAASRAHGNLNKLDDVAEELMPAQLTRLLGIKAGQAILQEIGRLALFAPKPPPLPPPPWERHVTLTADAPLPRRMNADHPERRAYHCKAHERHGEPPASAAWFNITLTDVWSQRLLTAVGIKGAELEAIVQAAKHAECNHSQTSTTNTTIYTDSQVAHSECRPASKSTSDRVHKIYAIACRLRSNHHTQLRVAWASAALGKPSTPIVPTIYSGPHLRFFATRRPAALANLERKKILRNLRTTASLFNRNNRMIPPMPAGVSRKVQTLVRRTATNTLMPPALRNRIFQDDPHQGYCTASNTLATKQHVIWECPEHAAARS
ncbi:hypothetical protein HPB47_020512, partial [Ixodes persulcatus]